MKAIMVMYDSLRRDLLPCYSEDTPLDMPNFQRLASKSLTFDKSYVCSMPAYRQDESFIQAGRIFCIEAGVRLSRTMIPCRKF
jgi:arylsulfatase A-like enzyme